MKKFLLSLAAFAATMGLSAQTGSWNATFSPVENAEDMGAVHVAQAGDGSVYASSIYSQAFTFGKTSVAAPEISGSSVIVKYNEKGEAQWAVSLHGAASVTALTADADGTLYAAGAYQDEVFIKDAKGSESTLAEGGMGFILKVSADGSVAVQKTFASAPNEEIEASFVYFPDDGDIYFTPTVLKVAGDKLYVGANYTGDVAELGWKGAYVDVWSFMYLDSRSKGIFSLNKGDLTNATNVAYAQITGSVSVNQYFPDSFDFVVENDKVYTFLYGFGDLTVTTADGAQNFQFGVDDEGNNEHGIAIIKLDGTDSAPTVFHAAVAEAPLSAAYKFSDVEVRDGVAIIGGTFYGDFPFTDAVETNEFDAAFVAAINLSTGAVKWSYQKNEASSTNAMVVTGENVHAISTLGRTTLKTATGVVSEEAAMKADDASAYADTYAAIVYAEETKVVVTTLDINATSVQSIDADTTTDAPAFSISGMPVDASYKGLIIKNGKKYLQR